jgi:hypothetical protein
MAEIKIERKQRSVLPWIIGLVLLVLVIWGLSRAMVHARTVDEDRGAAAADTLRDTTPPRLRQYAQVTDFDMVTEINGISTPLAA